MGAAPPAQLSRLAVIIPALDEALNLAELLPALVEMGLGQIIVADNGSTDGTPDLAARHGATVVREPHRGYGAACYAGMGCLRDSIDAVAFLDADLSDDPALLPRLAQPALRDECDLVIGARTPELRRPGSMTFTQRFGNWLSIRLIRLGWGFSYRDLGPFRVIRRSALEAIDMRDRAYGWTIEMQIRAVELSLRIREIPVPYFPRKADTKSKISGTLRGALAAGYCILGTCGSLWWTRRGRTRRRIETADERE